MISPYHIPSTRWWTFYSASPSSDVAPQADHPQIGHGNGKVSPDQCGSVWIIHFWKPSRIFVASKCGSSCKWTYFSPVFTMVIGVVPQLIVVSPCTPAASPKSTEKIAPFFRSGETMTISRFFKGLLVFLPWIGRGFNPSKWELNHPFIKEYHGKTMDFVRSINRGFLMGQAGGQPVIQWWPHGKLGNPRKK